MNCHDYSYCFLRYRQDPEAGEFANIGVALWSPDNRFLGFEGSKRFSRLTHFFGNLDKDGYRLLVAHVERRFDALAEKLTQDSLWPDHPADIKEIAFQVVPQDDGALVWSPARGGVTENPNAELGRLFQRYIGVHNEAPEKSRRDDGEVFRSVYRKAFATEALPHEFKNMRSWLRSRATLSNTHGKMESGMSMRRYPSTCWMRIP
jgi:hypothetical protein